MSARARLIALPVFALAAAVVGPSVVGGAATNPAMQRAVSDYLATRHGTVTLAVYDYVAKHTYEWSPKRRDYTASIVKVDILETLLHQRHGSLTAEQRAQARDMIEDSDNDDAEALWDDIGGGRGLTAFNKLVGLTGTRANAQNDWGLTTTSAIDQLRLLNLVAVPNKLLSRDACDYVAYLMRHVEHDQSWGTSYDAPRGAAVAVKNGWLPVHSDYDDWQLNSIAWVSGKGRNYVIAVLDRGNTSESYGIATIKHVTAIVCRYLKTA